jgi:hypothetical protein
MLEKIGAVSIITLMNYKFYFSGETPFAMKYKHYEAMASSKFERYNKILNFKSTMPHNEFLQKFEEHKEALFE